MDVMKTLFLNPPSYEDFDGGAGSRYQATREVWSFWYPTWLAYPAGMIPGARLLDAPPHNYTLAQTVEEAKNYDFVVLHTSTPSLRMDSRTAEAIKAANPDVTIAFVGGHPTAAPEETLKISSAIDIAGRKEFDHSMVEVAQGMDWSKIGGISYRKNGIISHNPDRAVLTGEELDRLPFVTEVYERNLDYLRYNSPYCQYPYVSIYTGRGCPAKCTFCLWPQVTQGHSYRTRSPENVFEEVAAMKAKFPKMKEVFFDDDTFTADPPRARKIAQLLKPLGLTWSTNSRANVDFETLEDSQGRRSAAVRGGLRERQRTDPQEHQKGGRTGSRPPLHPGLPQARDPDSRHLYPGGCRARPRRLSRSRLVSRARWIAKQFRYRSPRPIRGTELFRQVTEQGYLAVDPLLDELGYQRCTVKYPGLSADEIYGSVERFDRQLLLSAQVYLQVAAQNGYVK